MNTSERIKSLRLQKRLSQGELAKLTGYTDRSSIAKIESGKVDLSESKLLAFANALGVSPSYLIGLSEELLPSPSIPALSLSPEETQLIEDYRDASDEIREEASGMLHRSAERNRQEEYISSATAG